MLYICNMKYFLVIIFSFMHLSINSGAILKGKKINIPEIKEDNYQKTIDFLKKNEGFSPVFYDDFGYKAIGYGQRIAFYNDSIIEPITEIQGDSILKKSFWNHLKLIKKNFPKLNKNKQLALTHISYTVGFRAVNKLVKNNEIDTICLLKIGKKECRQFEINLYYGNKTN